MTGSQSLEWRTVVGLGLAAASAVAWAWAPRLHMARARFRRWAIGAFAISRLALFAATFFLLKMQPRGDINLYMQEAAPARAGKLVYRDFVTPHAPLSPYLFAAMLRVHPDERTIILFAVLFDAAAFAMWIRFSGRMTDALTERRAALLMICNPTSLITVAIDGQMNALIALGLAWSAVAVFEKRDALSGFAAAVPGVLVKFLSWIFVPVLFCAARRRAAWSAGFLGLTVLVYVAFAAGGANILVPLGAEGAHKTSSNIAFLFELLTGFNLGNRLPDVVFAVAWIAAIGFTARVMSSCKGDEIARRKVLLVGLITVMMVVQVFSKNTWDRYLVMTMYPLCWLAAEFNEAQMVVYCLWIAVCVTYRSAWSSMTGESSSIALHHALMQGDMWAHRILAGEAMQTAGNTAILVFAVRRLLLLSRAQIAAPAQRRIPTRVEPRRHDEAA